MKVNLKEPLHTNGFFKLKNQDWLDKQRVAGKVAAETLNILQSLVKEKAKLNLLELSRLAEDFILENKCTPTFKGYKGFPESVCISVNEQLVHGIPSEYYLQEGDLVTFDLGATFEGAIADTALTCIYGEPKKPEHLKLVQACEDSLMKGIAAISVGKKLGVIGHAINKSAKNDGFSVINDYGGHGLDWDNPHMPPFVANRADPEDGFRIQPGLAIAIEPLLTFGSPTTKIGDDGWTVYCSQLCAHFEHSIFVHEDRVEILTDRNNV